jgi:ATP-dependent helicase HrpA
VTSARHFDSWWNKARAGHPDLLTFTAADVAGPAAALVRPDDYPDIWGGAALSYRFAPGEPDDGVTAEIPLAALSQLDGDVFGWQVPGMREELVTELIRSLPKQLRRAFVPAADTARAVTARLGEPHGDLLDALGAELGRLGGVPVPREAWDLSRLPAHLRITFRITEGGRELASGKDLGELRRDLRPRLRAMLNAAAGDLTRTGVTDWTIGTLPRVISRGELTGYPALADAGGAADVRLFQTADEASAAMARGTRRLLLLQVPSGMRSIAGRLTGEQKLALSASPYPGVAALLDDCAACAADQVIADAGGPPWDADGFARLAARARSELPLAAARVLDVVARVLEAAHEADTRLQRTASTVPERPAARAPERRISSAPERPASSALAAAVADMRAQYAALVYPGFVSATGLKRLPDLVRYLRAISRRLNTMAEDPGRDAERMAIVHRVAGAYQQALAGLPAGRRCAADVQAVRWMIEELRVSLFAQLLGTSGPVSEKRINAALARLA